MADHAVTFPDEPFPSAPRVFTTILQGPVNVLNTAAIGTNAMSTSIRVTSLSDTGTVDVFVLAILP